MVRERYNPIPSHFLTEHCGVGVPEPLVPARVAADSPAIDVMTDLRRVPAATISSHVPLPDANQTMILRGVRLLLVVSDAGEVIGTVSAADLHGERPVLKAREHGLARDELTVRDLMTSADNADVLELDDVLHAEVGHVVATLQRLGRQHVLVIDRNSGDRPVIRGIFSASQIARQLGIAVAPTEVARTFAQIEAAFSQ